MVFISAGEKTSNVSNAAGTSVFLDCSLGWRLRRSNTQTIEAFRAHSLLLTMAQEMKVYAKTKEPVKKLHNENLKILTSAL